MSAPASAATRAQQSWRRLLVHARPRAASLAVVALLMLAGVAFDALKPWPLKLLIDKVLKTDAPRTELIVWLVAASVAIFLLTQITRIAQTYLLAGIGTRMSYRLGAAIFEQLQRLSLQVHARRSTGDLVRRTMTDCSCVRDLLSAVAIPVATSLAMLVTMFVILCRMDALLAAIAIGFALPLAGAIRFFAGPMSDRSLAQQNAEGEMIASAERALSAIPLVQTFAAEAREDQRFVEQARRTLKAYLRSMTAQYQFTIGTGAVTAVGTAVVMCVGGWRALNGHISAGDLLVFLSYLASLYAPLETLSYVSVSYASASASKKRVLEILDSTEMVRERHDAVPIRTIVSADGPRISVRFDNVTFGYDANRPVLSAIDLEIPAGQTVALVGPTGAGKSTLASLVPRLYDPWDGAVRFNGVDVRQLRLSDVRAAVSVVPQDSPLLPLSVADNIAYGRPGASRDEIVAAAVAASADEFIRALPNGYDTMLGQRGATLSGGQRQRIAIARALLKNSPILILDEPTSAVDLLTEQHVLAGMSRLSQGRTCIVIAHRLSTIRNADRVILVERGRAIMQGAPAQAMTGREAWQRMEPLEELADEVA